MENKVCLFVLALTLMSFCLKGQNENNFNLYSAIFVKNVTCFEGVFKLNSIYNYKANKDFELISFIDSLISKYSLIIKSISIKYNVKEDGHNFKILSKGNLDVYFNNRGVYIFFPKIKNSFRAFLRKLVNGKCCYYDSHMLFNIDFLYFYKVISVMKYNLEPSFSYPWAFKYSRSMSKVYDDCD